MIRSPIKYMGNKYDLLTNIFNQLPQDKDYTFYDLFGGSGVVSLNADYDRVIYNELNVNVYNLFKMFKEYSAEEIINHIKKRIEEFDLPVDSTDIRGVNVTKEYIEQSKENYLKFRDFYNKSDKDILDLFTLTELSFCNLMRFNSKNEFNMPFGIRAITSQNEADIKTTCNVMKYKNIIFKNKNAFDILDEIIKEKPKNTIVYLDPPYSNSTAIYNEQRAFGGWSIDDDLSLFNKLDAINEIGVEWVLSNVSQIKGKNNDHLIKWATEHNYHIMELDKSYASLGKGNANAIEVLIMNFKPRYEQLSLFDF